MADTQPTLHEQIASAARTVQLRLGPNALGMAQRQEPIRLSGGEADQFADAVLAIVQPKLDRLRAELEPYEVLNPQQCPAGVHPDWLVDSEHTHACPWCETDRLRTEIRAQGDALLRQREQLSGARHRALTEGADRLDRLADFVEGNVAAHYAHTGIGAGSADMVRECARTLRELAARTTTDTE